MHAFLLGTAEWSPLAFHPLRPAIPELGVFDVVLCLVLWVAASQPNKKPNKTWLVNRCQRWSWFCIHGVFSLASVPALDSFGEEIFRSTQRQRRVPATRSYESSIPQRSPAFFSPRHHRSDIFSSVHLWPAEQAKVMPRPVSFAFIARRGFVGGFSLRASPHTSGRGFRRGGLLFPIRRWFRVSGSRCGCVGMACGSRCSSSWQLYCIKSVFC